MNIVKVDVPLLHKLSLIQCDFFFFERADIAKLQKHLPDFMKYQDSYLQSCRLCSYGLFHFFEYAHCVLPDRLRNTLLAVVLQELSLRSNFSIPME
jgi:hypothetical protein